MNIIINPEKLVKRGKPSTKDKSDIALLVDKMVSKIDALYDACVTHEQMPNSEAIKDLIRLTRSIDKLCFTIDNYRYLKEKQHFNR